jgi:hypothetical protein
MESDVDASATQRRRFLHRTEDHILAARASRALIGRTQPKSRGRGDNKRGDPVSTVEVRFRPVRERLSSAPPRDQSGRATQVSESPPERQCVLVLHRQGPMLSQVGDRDRAGPSLSDQAIVARYFVGYRHRLVELLPRGSAPGVCACRATSKPTTDLSVVPAGSGSPLELWNLNAPAVLSDRADDLMRKALILLVLRE